MATNENLRTQFIDAISERMTSQPMTDAVDLFDNAIMPLLQKAMDAGEMLVARNTEPKRNVHDSIMNWVVGMLAFGDKVKTQEHTISKRQLLTCIYQLSGDAAKALYEAAGGDEKAKAELMMKHADFGLRTVN